jgi:hypothetical protein
VSPSSTPSTSARGRLAIGAGRAGLARAIGLAGALVALVLVVGILLVVLGANRSNELVHWFRQAADWLAGPFNGLFHLHKHKAETAVNWGIAAAVWLILARVIARVVR